MKESCEDKYRELAIKFLFNFISIFLGIGIGLIISSILSKNLNKPETPNIIETEHKIDSLNQVIETLEAIKNGKIEEIKNLNDSATLNLFNELVSR